MVDKIDLTIIIPAYNEEKRIGKSLEKVFSYLSSKDYISEVIVINDGSKDNTASILSNYTDPRLSVIENSQNRGKGYSVKRGVSEAKGNFIIFSDADLSTPIEEVEKLSAALRDGYELVIGSRYISGADVRIKQPWYRQLMGRVFNLFVRLMAIPDIRDTQCGFKGFKKDCAHRVFEQMDTAGYSFDVEVIYLAHKFGFKMKEVPIIWIDSPSSRINPFIDPVKMFLDVFKIIWKHRNLSAKTDKTSTKAVI